MINKLSWNSQIVNLETGQPSQFFIMLWQALLERVEKVTLPDNPVDGDVLVLTYSADKKKWIGS